MLAPGYQVQVYSTYQNAGTNIGSMCFDNSGNLYMANWGNNNLWRVLPNGSAGVLASGLDTPSGVEWTGGTSYGNYLYATANTTLQRVSTTGSRTTFATGLPAASEVAVDKTGNYGGYLYVSTGGQDHIYRVSTTGTVSMWSNWPGWKDNGGPIGLEFDTTGNYNGNMYVATYFGQPDAAISGLFALDTAGNATRFSPDLALAAEIGFDNLGLFGNAMFAVASESFINNYSVWKVAADGHATKFATMSIDGLGSLAFGPDGAMYVSEYTSSNGMITVSRITPEPATFLLLGLGAAVWFDSAHHRLRKKARN